MLSLSFSHTHTHTHTHMWLGGAPCRNVRRLVISAKIWQHLDSSLVQLGERLSKMELPDSIINLIWTMAGVSSVYKYKERENFKERERYCALVVYLGVWGVHFLLRYSLFGEKRLKCENYLAAHGSWKCILFVVIALSSTPPSTLFLSLSLSPPLPPPLFLDDVSKRDRCSDGVSLARVSKAGATDHKNNTPSLFFFLFLHSILSWPLVHMYTHTPTHEVNFLLLKRCIFRFHCHHHTPCA